MADPKQQNELLFYHIGSPHPEETHQWVSQRNKFFFYFFLFFYFIFIFFFNHQNNDEMTKLHTEPRTHATTKIRSA